MQTYTDYTPGLPAEQPRELESRPVMPAEVLSAPEAATRVYEHGSIAEMIQQMFREADEQAAEGIVWTSVETWQREFPADTEVYRDFMIGVQQRLHQRDSVRALRAAVKEGRPITVQDIAAVFRAYEAAVQAMLQSMRGEISLVQFRSLRQAAQSELDWSFRDLLRHHVLASANDDQGLTYSPADFFLILNPKARKIDYMNTGEILTTLRHSFAQAGTEQLKRDLQIVHRYEALPAVQSLQSEPEYASLTKKV